MVLGKVTVLFERQPFALPVLGDDRLHRGRHLGVFGFSV